MVMKQYTETNSESSTTTKIKPVDRPDKSSESKIRSLEEYVQTLEREIRKNQRDIARLKDDINAITLTLRRG